MLTVISPAKSLDFETAAPIENLSFPRLADRTERLARSLGRKSRDALQKIIPVSDKLIELNRNRYRNFFDQPEKQAIFAYNGDVYIGLEARTMDDAALAFGQTHLRILSGLYGLLRPLDAIRPHRLEMGTKWAPSHARLTDFWGNSIFDLLRRDMEEAGAQVLINLASQEYWAVVAPYAHRHGMRVISVDFRQEGPDGPKFQSFAAKRARGMMARFICDNHLIDPDQLKSFDSDGYRFVAGDSDETLLRFVRA